MNARQNKRSLLERGMTLLGRRVKMRGVPRLIQNVYPVNKAQGRYVYGVRRRADGLTMHLDSRSWIDWNVLFRGAYEPHLAALIQRFLEPGAVGIDIGANIGVHTLTMAHAVGDKGKVVAVEPQTGAAAILRQNLQLNGYGDRVNVMEVAIGAEEDKLVLSVPDTGGEYSFRSGLATLGELTECVTRHEVSVRTLDNIVEELRIERLDLVKADVQGHEPAVLQGMGKVLQSLRPAVVFEYEPGSWQDAGADWKEVVAIFQQNKYRLAKVSQKHPGRFTPLKSVELPGAHVELLGLPDEIVSA